MKQAQLTRQELLKEILETKERDPHNKLKIQKLQQQLDKTHNGN